MLRTDPQFITNQLRRLGTRAKHSLGQHFLIDQSVLDAVVTGGELQAGDIVIEIGPGLGTLTECLLDAGCIVHAFELDQDLIELLMADFPQALQEGTLVIHVGDAIQLLPALLPTLQTYKVVANIPYQITTPLLQLLYRPQTPEPERVSLLVQLELAERLAAAPATGERAFLSVLMQYYACPKLVRKVLPSAFLPPPAVTSAVLVLEKREERPLPVNLEEKFIHFVRTSFLQRRKQLKNVLAGIRGCSTQEMSERLTNLGFPLQIRAQELSESDWIKLFKAEI